MAIAQDDFTLYRGKAYEGQISTTDVVEVVSRKVETALVQFGRAVIRGSENRSCAPIAATTTAAEIIGFSVRSMATSSPSVPTNPANYVTGYAVDAVASVLRRGPMFALCVDGASAGDTASVILTAGENQGRLTTGTGETLLALNQVKWIDDVVAGEIGEIRVDGILNVSA
ncbi:structural cement protein Gp24 [Brenneria goodwinii]|uniref:structural cement protein Gp24 n=1 Tax=Brenneria goodwinii TaxID=1109412 RepID=UPI0036EC913A